MPTDHPPSREALDSARDWLVSTLDRSPCICAECQDRLARAFARYHAEGLRRMADAHWPGVASVETVRALIRAEAARHAPEAEGE